MKRYIVEIIEDALSDMEELYNHIAKKLHAPDTAARQYERIADAILKLDTFPERFEVIDSEPENSRGIRKMVIDNFLICYIVGDEVVTVLAVLYGASEIHGKLKARN